jgi:hypothetical protein
LPEETARSDALVADLDMVRSCGCTRWPSTQKRPATPELTLLPVSDELGELERLERAVLSFT